MLYLYLQTKHSTQGEHKLKKHISLLISLLIIFSVFLSGCDRGYYVPSPVAPADIYKPENVSELKPAEVISTVGITLFSWQIPSPEYAEKYCSKIKECGFDCVEIVVLWSDIEPEQGKFQFTQSDTVIDVFKNAGLKISLSLLFWSEQLEWKDTLEYQQTADGEIYRYDDIRGSFLALNSQSNLEIMANTLGYFAAHFSDRYADCLTSWSIRTDCFAKMEYSSLVDLDYSPSAISAFIDFLRGKYTAIENLNAKFEKNFESFESLENLKRSDFRDIFEYDWKLFKQQTLIDTANISTEIFRIADPSIPVTLQLSSFWDTSAAFYRGFFDPYIVSRETTADIIQIVDAPAWPHDFSVDLLTSLSGKKICMETDGSWQGEDTFKEYLKQVEMSARSGVTAIQTVNWELEDLEKYGATYLSKFKELYSNAEPRKDYDETDVIFVNTLDFLLKAPPQDLHDLYYYAYKNMTGSSGKKVRFITDTQLIEDPSLIEGIKKVHLGQLDTVMHMKDEAGRILAESSAIIVDDRNEQPNFINEFEQPLSEDIQVKLREKLKNS